MLHNDVVTITCAARLDQYYWAKTDVTLGLYPPYAAYYASSARGIKIYKGINLSS